MRELFRGNDTDRPDSHLGPLTFEESIRGYLAPSEELAKRGMEVFDDPRTLEEILQADDKRIAGQAQ